MSEGKSYEKSKSIRKSEALGVVGSPYSLWCYPQPLSGLSGGYPDRFLPPNSDFLGNYEARKVVYLQDVSRGTAGDFLAMYPPVN